MSDKRLDQTASRGLSVPDGWNGERVEVTRQMWREGASASEIARAIGGGLSRNAVIGKLHREKLMGRPKKRAAPKIAAASERHQTATAASNRAGSRAAGVEAKAASRKVTMTRPASAGIGLGMRAGDGKPVDDAPLHSRAWEPAPGQVLVPLVALDETTCKWPIGDPLELGFGFCGCPPIEGKPYCAAHLRRAYDSAPKPQVVAKVRKFAGGGSRMLNESDLRSGSANRSGEFA